MFTTGGDGLKNYYVFAYHVANDSSILTFEGMNYPYGEHLFFASGNPFLSNVTKSIAFIFPGIVDYSVAILNLFTLLSLYGVSLFSYLILRDFKVNFIVATLGAIMIMLICPQVNRFGGHLNLGFCSFFLINWFLLIKVEKRGTLLLYALLFAFNLLCFLIHPYLGFMNVLYDGVYLLFMFLFKRLSTVRLLKRGFTFSLLPIVVFYVLLNSVNNKSDRNPHPGVVENSRATFESVFLPRNGVQRAFLEEKFQPYNVEFEQESSIGTFTAISIIFIIVTYIILAIQRKRILHNVKLLVPALASIFMLLFAFGVFRNILAGTPLENFRTLGRFAWVFFYVANIICLVAIYRLSKINRLAFVLFLLMIPNIIDGYEFSTYIKGNITRSDNYFKSATPNFISYTAFQAILPLPHFSVSHENFRGIPDEEVLKKSMLLSVKEALPIVPNFLSRGSYSEIKKGMQVYAHNNVDKQMQYDLNSEKPFLIIYKEDASKTSYENNIISKSKHLGTDDNGFAYGLITPKELFNRTTYKEQLRSLQQVDQPILYFDFEEDGVESSVKLFGNKTREVVVKDYTKIGSLDTSKIQKDTKYMVSFWVNNCIDKDNHSPQNIMFIVDVSRPDGSGKWEEISNPAYSVELLDCRTLVETEFEIEGDFKEVGFMFKGYDLSPYTIYVDEFQVRKLSDTTHIKISENEGLINNYYYYN